MSVDGRKVLVNGRKVLVDGDERVSVDGEDVLVDAGVRVSVDELVLMSIDVERLSLRIERSKLAGSSENSS